MALAMAGSAWAVSPYDTAYGVQWNFMIGIAGSQDAFQTEAAVVSDGTLFVTNRTGVATWGSGVTGSVNGGVGAITPLGKLIYGTTLRSLPGMVAPNQNYLTGINAVGNTAYFGLNGAGAQSWTGQDTSDNNRVMTYSLDSSGLASIANQRRLTKYKDAVGTLRTDGLGPILPGAGLNQPAQNRSLTSALRASTLDMIIVGNSNSDFATAGDFGTTGNYGCFVGRYNLTTNTLTGPAKQPVVYNITPAVIRGDYTRAGINQSTGRYYAAGVPSANAVTLDPDGAGGIAGLPLDADGLATSSNGFVVAYDGTTDSILHTVIWDSPTVGTTTQRINAIVPTNDATDSVFLVGSTNGDMPGVTPGTNLGALTYSDAYVELRDASGAVLWFDQLALSSTTDIANAAEVLANGDLIVTGSKDGATAGIRDTWMRKYKKTGPSTYVAAWTTTIVNPLDPTNTKNDQIQDSAFESTGDAVYVTVQGTNQWNNTTGHVYSGTSDDILVHKLSPGDFNANGIVDFADVQIAGTATKPGLTGVDTYDFNGDGDSTLADTTFMITNIMDRLVGDIAQDTLVTDVDNADIGRAIGASGVGTLYLDGDIDFDGDVDTADITAMAAALSFTGAKAPGKWTNGTPGATLRYRASDGQVWLHADEATGDIITSFQLENAAGTFVPANFTGPTGGSFGGSLKEATTSVLADTDLTLAGSGGLGGLISLGTVLPTGLDLAGLTAYLKTAVYTGQSGSGQMQFTLLVGDLLTPYESWTAGFGGLTNKYSNIDFDGGGLDTGHEWIVGGDPTVSGDDAGNAPTLNNSDPNNFKFVFKRRDAAAADSTTIIVVEYGSDLMGWRNTAVHGAIDGVTTDASVDLGGGFHQVTVSIPKSLAVNGKLFARLAVSGLPFSLLSASFESDDGGFTISKVAGTDWAWGAPTSSGTGGTVNLGNGLSLKCWGTNIGAPGYYVDPTTDSRLTSPVIDLTSVVGAKLSFAYAIDIPVAGDSAVVRIFNANTNVEIVAGVFPLTVTDSNINTADWQNSGPHDLPSGAPIRVVWTLTGTGGASDDYMGWYVDDILVVKP